MIGFGSSIAGLVVYIANRPAMEKYADLQEVSALQDAELDAIVDSCGNHWRKIFNIYAKLGFFQDSAGYTKWQDYRDHFLLRQGSGQALIFDQRLQPMADDAVHLIAGKAHARLLLGDAFELDSQGFFIAQQRRLIVCPYFDYRQLSNAKIEHLLKIIAEKRAA